MTDITPSWDNTTPINTQAPLTSTVNTTIPKWEETKPVVDQPVPKWDETTPLQFSPQAELEKLKQTQPLEENWLKLMPAELKEHALSDIADYGKGIVAGALPFGIGEKVSGKPEGVAGQIGAGVGSLASFIAPGAAAGQITKIPAMARTLTRIADIPKYGKFLSTAVQHLITTGATFGLQGQIQTPVTTSIKERAKILGDSELQAALFAGAGVLGATAGKTGKVLTYPAMFGIGYGTAGEDASPTDKFISGAVLVFLHALSSGKPRQEAEKITQETVKEQFKVDDAKAQEMTDAVLKTPEAQNIADKTADLLGAGITTKTPEELSVMASKGEIPLETSKIQKPSTTEIKGTLSAFERTMFIEEQRILRKSLEERGYNTLLLSDEAGRMAVKVGNLDFEDVRRFQDLSDALREDSLARAQKSTLPPEKQATMPITPPVAEGAKPINVYRGELAPIHESRKQISGIQDIGNLIGIKTKPPQAPFEFFTTDKNDAKSYSIRDQDFVNSYESRFPGRGADVFRSLHGHEPRTTGEIKKHQINPKKVFDLTKIGERISQGDMVRLVNDALGNKALPQKWGWKDLPENVSKEMDNYGLWSVGGENNLPTWTVFRNKMSKVNAELIRQGKASISGSGEEIQGNLFAQWLIDHGYDAVKYLHEGDKKPIEHFVMVRPDLLTERYVRQQIPNQKLTRWPNYEFVSKSTLPPSAPTTPKAAEVAAETSVSGAPETTGIPTKPEAEAGALLTEKPTRKDFNVSFDFARDNKINPKTGKLYTEAELYDLVGHYDKNDPIGNVNKIKKLQGIEKGPLTTPRIPVSQKTVKTELVSTKDVVQQIEESFGLPIRIGRFRAKAVGIYKEQPEVARTKMYGDIATSAHEAAHHLDNVTAIINNLPLGLKTELAKLDYEPAKQRPSEGFAEYLRLKITTDNEAFNKAPNFDTWFDYRWLPNHSEWKTKIDQVKNIVTQWRQEGAVNRVMGQINKESGKFKTLKEWVQNPKQFFQGIYDAVYDRQAALWRAQEKITGTTKLADIPAQYRFAEAAKVLNMAAPTKVRQMVETGMVDVAGNKTGASLKESLDPINESITTPEGQREFEAFLYARHALDVRKAGKEPGISREDAQFTVDELGKRPGWEKAADGISKWHEGLLDYLIDAGGLTSDAKAKMKALYPNYIPLFRAMEGTKGGMAGGRKLADLGRPLQRLKGSGREIISPLENSVVQAERIVGVADTIRIGRMMADASEHYHGAGKIIERVSPEMTASSQTVKRLKDQLQKAGVNLDNADMDTMLTMYENVYRGSTKDNVIVLWRNGKQEMYQVDPDVYRALTNLDQQFQLPKVVDWIFGKPARLLRLTTTGLRAGFSMITNPLRDTMTSVMQTRVKGYEGSLPVKVADNIAGIYHDIIGTETARLFKAGGGEMGQPLAIDRVFTQEAIQEMLAITPKQKVMNWSRHPIDSLRQLFSVTELGPRLAEFERVLKQKGWKEGQKLTLEQYLDAQMAAADVTVDFRQGGWLGMWLNRMTAFHNANVQGPLQMVQAFKRDPSGTVGKGILWMTMPTLALWWKNKDKEWYKNLPAFEKYGYWHVPIGKTVIRVPRPFEWGVLFASIPEAMAQAAYEKNPEHFKEVAGQSFQILTPPVVPTAVNAPMETIFNYDTFRRRPIVSRGMEFLKPEDQTYFSTTETANKLGKLLGVSPAKIEFLMSSYTGSLSTEILHAGEAGLRIIGGQESKGTRPSELSDLPIVGRLFLRPNTTKIFDDFYSKAEELNQAYSSAKLHGELRNFRGMQQRSIFNSTVEQLQLFRKEAKVIVENIQIPDDQKRSRLQLIQDKMARIAKLALEQSANK